MRKINPQVKELINTTRYNYVRDNEVFDAFLDSSELEQKMLLQLETLLDETVENQKQKLFVVLQMEANEVTMNFDVFELSSLAGSAFPWEDVEAMPESINEYIGELVSDVFDAVDIPSSQIADEFEVWLDSLWNHYEKR